MQILQEFRVANKKGKRPCEFGRRRRRQAATVRVQRPQGVTEGAAKRKSVVMQEGTAGQGLLLLSIL